MVAKILTFLNLVRNFGCPTLEFHKYHDMYIINITMGYVTNAFQIIRSLAKGKIFCTLSPQYHPKSNTKVFDIIYDNNRIPTSFIS